MAEKIDVTFLGTGSAIPTARRNHPAVLLKYKNENILMDCGEGTQRQFRKAKLNPCKITRILISHWHGDHVLGLPGLLQTMMLNGYNKTLKIYGPSGTKRKMRLYLDLFAHKGEKLSLEVHEVKEGIFIDEKEFFVGALPMDHDSPANAYSFVVKEQNRIDKKKLAKLKLPNSPLIGELVRGKVVKIGGKKINGKKLMYVEPARKISFVMDTRMTPNAVKISKDAELLICETTYSSEEKEIAFEHAHLTSTDSAAIAKKAKVKKLALMHLSQRYEAIPKVILGEVKKAVGGGKGGIEVSIPEDLTKLEV
jgi:ribonuclease Z